MVGAAAARGVCAAVGIVAAGTGVAAAANTLAARSLRSWTVTQLVMSTLLGIEMIVATTVRLQSRITTLACGPVPTRHATVVLARDRVPPNLAQLWVLRTVPSGPVRSTAASISSTSALTHLATVLAGAKASEKAFMFLLASFFPARLLRCCIQLFERMAIVVLLELLIQITRSSPWIMYVPYKVEPKMNVGSSSGWTMNRDPAQKRSTASLGALLQADGVKA